MNSAFAAALGLIPPKTCAQNPLTSSPTKIVEVDIGLATVDGYEILLGTVQKPWNDSIPQFHGFKHGFISVCQRILSIHNITSKKGLERGVKATCSKPSRATGQPNACLMASASSGASRLRFAPDLLKRCPHGCALFFGDHPK